MGAGVVLTRRLALACALLAAMLAAGCGGGATRTLGGSSAVPGGFTRYQGDGVSLVVPEGFSGGPVSIPGVPTGASTVRLTSSGQSPAIASSEILLLYNPNLQLSLNQVASNLRQEDAANSAVSHLQTSVRAVTVAHAHAARIVTESYVTRVSSSSPATALFHRTWLMMLIKPGDLIDVVIVNEPDRGGRLDANTILNSVRLDKR